MSTIQDNSAVVGRYWSVAENSKLRCELCPRNCLLSEGQRGMCFVRQRAGDKILLNAYGRSSGFCVDPIEKKPLNHFFPGSAVLSFGTAGCNLACKFCQNWDISKSREMSRLAEYASPEAIARSAVRAGCTSVAFTYNDPVIFLEYAVDVAIACQEQGLKTVAVTAGYINPKPREEFFKHLDAVNIDLKAFDQTFYKRLCAADLAPVKETIAYVAQETDVWLELTTLLIPGENDSPREIAELCEWVVEKIGRAVPLHFTAFHPDFKMMNHKATPNSTLNRAWKQARSTELQHVYTGNAHLPRTASTYCAECGQIVIGRDWYKILEYHLDAKGRCEYCQSVCVGRFEGSAGAWGPRRERIAIY